MPLAGALVIALLAMCLPEASGQEAPAASSSLFIQEYRVQGAKHLPRDTVEETVYPYLGPGRSADDVEQARAALEKAYRDAGFQAVSVQIPQQQVSGGVVVLQVSEGTVERLRVKGAKYSPPSSIKAMVPSLAEGNVVNFTNIPKEIVALNQQADRRVTPSLRAGDAPGTVDVDLNVVETSPLHANVELNNRRSANTTALRLNGSVSDNNFLQRGDSVGLSFQVAPERAKDAEVFSGYYVTHVPTADGLGLMLQATKQDSNISTLGGAAVVGKGETVGWRALLHLPAAKNFFQSLSLGLDYKHYDQTLRVAGNDLLAPITYWPISASYSATLVGEHRESDLNLTGNVHLRGMGSDPAAFDTRRYASDGAFMYLRGDISHTRDLEQGAQIFVKAQGQLANEALLDSEQFSGGGLNTARGYLESEAVGDNALFGTLELRSPVLAAPSVLRLSDWRVYFFGDAGMLKIYHALPQQDSHSYLASYGVGTRLHLLDRVYGSLDAGIPVIAQGSTKVHDLRFVFRLWADF